MTLKKDLSERDICTKYIIPALKISGWDIEKQVREEVYFTDGKIYIDGKDISKINPIELRRNIGYVIQKVGLLPHMTVGENIELVPLLKHWNPEKRNKRAKELLDLVGLPSNEYYQRYPNELSGGQQQRIGIARALALKPEFIVLDEPVSALDVCIQAQILNLMNSLQKQFNLTYLFISHNLSVVKHVSDRIAVMYLGKIVELSDYKSIFKNPLHPYTQALLSAIPIPKVDVQKEKIILEGDVPSPIDVPTGCKFQGRCPIVEDICRVEKPELREVLPGHEVACHMVKIK